MLLEQTSMNPPSGSAIKQYDGQGNFWLSFSNIFLEAARVSLHRNNERTSGGNSHDGKAELSFKQRIKAVVQLIQVEKSFFLIFKAFFILSAFFLEVQRYGKFVELT